MEHIVVKANDKFWYWMSRNILLMVSIVSRRLSSTIVSHYPPIRAAATQPPNEVDPILKFTKNSFFTPYKRLLPLLDIRAPFLRSLSSKTNKLRPPIFHIHTTQKIASHQILFWKLPYLPKQISVWANHRKFSMQSIAKAAKSSGLSFLRWKNFMDPPVTPFSFLFSLSNRTKCRNPASQTMDFYITKRPMSVRRFASVCNTILRLLTTCSWVSLPLLDRSNNRYTLRFASWINSLSKDLQGQSSWQNRVSAVRSGRFFAQEGRGSVFPVNDRQKSRKIP